MSRRRTAEMIVDKKYKWLIKWEYFPHSHNSWEPLKNLMSCKHMVAEFEAGRNSMTNVKIVPSQTEKLAEKGTTDSLGLKNVFEVEQILDKQLFYLVKWRGYPASKNEWLAENQLRGHENLIQDFAKRRNEKKNKTVPSPSTLNAKTSSHRDETAVKVDKVSLHGESSSSSPHTSQSSSRNPVTDPVLHSIHGITKLDGGEIKFVVKWENGTVGIIPAATVKTKWPQHVIEFYEKHLKLH